MDEEKRCPAIDLYESDEPPEKVLEACEHCHRKLTDCPIFQEEQARNGTSSEKI